MEQFFKNHAAQQLGLLNLQLIDAKAYIDLLATKIQELNKQIDELSDNQKPEKE